VDWLDAFSTVPAVVNEARSDRKARRAFAKPAAFGGLDPHSVKTHANTVNAVRQVRGLRGIDTLYARLLACAAAETVRL
jgi:hypothetical protein